MNFSENKIRIDGEETLHKFGEYIESYLTNREKTEKYGTFVCKNCQGKFIHYNASIKEKSRIYCKECAKELELEEYTGVVKSVVCQDCGREVSIDINDVKTCRCAECQKKYRNAYIAKKMRENYWLATLEINKDNISVGIGEIDSNIKEKLEPVWGTFKDITEEDAKKIVILMKNTHKRDFTYKILEETEGKEEKTVRVISYS